MSRTSPGALSAVREVIAATEVWVQQLDPTSEADAHHLLESLWVHQQHNVVNRDLLDLVLNSPVAHARIAARTVERMWDHNTAPPVEVASARDEEVVEDTGGPDADAIVIKTVAEEMRYDTPSFTVSAGQLVTIQFENGDYLPHNLIIGQPGSAEEIGAAADRLGADGFAKAFVPENDKIIVASDLLNYEKFQVLEFRAPTVPGDYDFLCTFPGHRQTMNGVMKVVNW